MAEDQRRIPTFSKVLSDPRYSDFARLILELNKKWQPHPGQLLAGNLVFNEGVRRLFIECGRKWGKTDWALDFCWRMGNMIRKGQGYYFAAYAKAVREIIWAPRRLQDWGPQEFVKKINENEMRITFTTDTFVKADGADEFKFTKGFNPDFAVLDEFADYHERFWQAMSPNFASKDALVIIISSPPWLLEDEDGNPVLFVRLADLWKNYQEEAARLGRRSKYHFINQPTAINAKNLPPGFLEQEKQDNRLLGTSWFYEREYEAKRVVGGGTRLIGTFEREQHMVPHEVLMKEVSDKADRLEWATAVDPSNTAFGTLLMAIDPETKEVYFMDEIMEKSDNATLEHILWPRIEEKENELYPKEVNPEKERFTRVCDEAAKWWIVGCANDERIGVHFQATQKETNSIDFGCSLLRAIFLFNKGKVSDRCKVFIWQLENWRRDKAGQIPTRKKDIIDCARYGLHALNYYISMADKEVMEKPHVREQLMAARQSLEEDMGGEEGEILDDLEDYVRDEMGRDDDEGDAWPYH